MHNHIICPKCKNSLNVERHVIFVVEKNDGSRGLVLLSSEIGDYSIRNNPSIEIEEGERLEFYCPVCHGKLSVQHHPNLVRVLMKEKSGNECEVYFSRIVGQKSTYLIKQDGKVEPFGYDSSEYFDALM